MRSDYSLQRQFLTELFRTDVKIEQRRFSIFAKTLKLSCVQGTEAADK
jgi:hypothetical protein